MSGYGFRMCGEPLFFAAMKTGLHLRTAPLPLHQTELTVVDVHRDFKAEAQIVVARFFPSHTGTPEFCVVWVVTGSFELRRKYTMWIVAVQFFEGFLSRFFAVRGRKGPPGVAGLLWFSLSVRTERLHIA
jgi:hypothetical protein